MQLPMISVCVCTFRRPALLKRCLDSLIAQDARGRFDFRVIVVDNDKEQSARAVVEQLTKDAGGRLFYAVEPQQGIARARNKAVQCSTGDFVAFIDDDEFAPADWLENLFTHICKPGVDGVLAPVNPAFEEGAPKWVIEGGFYDRPPHPTGMVLHWRQCRTGNVLLKRELLTGSEEPFNPECLSGEDQDFFRRKIADGHQFIWCHEAGVLEVVPPGRWKRGFLVRRALFRGVFAQRNHGIQPVRLMQAVVSAPAYAILLPFALILGQARFMTCVFKMSYHTGRLLALFGFNPIQQPYVFD